MQIFLGNKKIQTALTVIFFLIILISSVSIRLSGLPNLIDQTTGKYVFADPDAFYEYRVAETIVSGQEISGIDSMRSPGLGLTYTQEMLPKILAFAYKIIHPIKSSITLDYIAAVYPVVAFAFSLVFFFILLSFYLFFSSLWSYVNFVPSSVVAGGGKSDNCQYRPSSSLDCNVAINIT